MCLYEKYPSVCIIKDDIEKAIDMLFECYKAGSKILVCGNGGSAADSEHIVGELMKSFMLPRPVNKEFADRMKELFPDVCEYFTEGLQGAIPAISLPSQIGINSAFINDVSPDLSYAQLVYGYARRGDAVIGLSTSGNSANVVNAMMAAKAAGCMTISLTGRTGGRLNGICDITIRVPESETYKIQELHLPVYHYICAELEKRAFGV